MMGLAERLLYMAQAEGADPMGAGCQQTLLFMGVIFAIFYFIMIRPQRKQQQEQQRFLDRLKEGDRVVMTSGIFGRIVKLEPDLVTLDVGDRTRIRFLRNQVSRSQADPTAATDTTDSADDESSDSLKGESPRVGSRRKRRR